MKRKEAYSAFYPYFKPYRIRFFAACVFLALSYVVLFSSVGVMLSNVFSLVSEKESAILTSSLLYLLLVVLATVISSLCLICFTKVEYAVQNAIREDILSAYVHGEECKTGTYTAEEILNRLTIDLPYVSHLFGEYMAGWVYEPFLAGIFCVIYLFHLNVLAAMVCILCALLGFGSVHLYAKQKAEAEGNASKAKGLALKYISEAIYGSEEIRTFSLQKRFEKKAFQFFEPVSDNLKASGKYQSIRGFCIHITMNCLSYLLILVTGGFLAEKGYLPFSKILVGISMIDLIWQGLVSIGLYSNFLEEALPHEERLLEILRLPEMVDTREEGTEEIAFHDVCFSYPDHSEVLHSLSFRISAGKKVAFVGESGSGKSTCAKLLAGIYMPRSGTVSIPSGSTITYMPQEISLFQLNMYENIALSFTPDIDKVMQSSVCANADGFLKEKGFTYVPDKENSGFSGGQLQRISLARTFYQNGDIWILDEPTASLDEDNTKAIQESLKAVPTDTTVVVISHRISFIQDFDYVYVFQQGTIVEEGNPQSLLQKEGYLSALYELQKR